MEALLAVLLIGCVVYFVFLDPTQSILLSKRDRMHNMREKNRRRGIHMRPNWTYTDPDTQTRYRSSTGKLEDSIDIATGKPFVPQWYRG